MFASPLGQRSLQTVVPKNKEADSWNYRKFSFGSFDDAKNEEAARGGWWDSCASDDTVCCEETTLFSSYFLTTYVEASCSKMKRRVSSSFLSVGFFPLMHDS